MSLSKQQIEDYLKEHLKDYSYHALKKQMLNHGANESDIEEVYSNLNNSKSSDSNTVLPNVTKKNSNSQTNIINLKKKRYGFYKKGIKLLGKFLVVVILCLIVLFAVSTILFPHKVSSIIFSEKGEFSGYFDLDKNSQFENSTNEIFIILNPISEQDFYLYEKDSKNLLTLQGGELCELSDLTRLDENLNRIVEDISFDNIQSDSRGINVLSNDNLPVLISKDNLVQLTFTCENQDFKDYLAVRIHLNLFDLESKQELYVQNNYAFVKN